MSIRENLLYSLGAALVPGMSAVGQQPADGRPNILLIVVDDMGYSDIAPFGGEIRTPNLDSLAARGVRSTNFHTSSLSAPTRAMLLTGVDNHRNGLGAMPPLHAENQYGRPGYEGYLNDRVRTLPEVLRDNGYYTCMAGKWHLGALPGQWPSDRGFTNSLALAGGGAGHFADSFALCDAEKPVTFYVEDGKKTDTLPDDFYSTRSYADKMIEYIRHRPAGKPFFGYLAFTAPHDPLQVIDGWEDKYTGEYDCGYDSIAARRLERQKALELVPAPIMFDDIRGHYPHWETLPQEIRKEQSRKMEIYAAMIEYVDYSIGRVIAELKRNGTYDNTLIVFMSDNGANPKEPSDYPGNTPEGIARSYDNRSENYGKDGSFISLGKSWAETSNTPYSYYKQTTAEGGIRVPFLISGPGIAGHRTDTESVLHVTDVFPTMLDYAQVKRPSVHNGKELHPLYGKSMKGMLSGTERQVRSAAEAVCFEMAGCRAVIKGTWKAVSLTPPYGDGKQWKLYDLRTDPSEKKDRAADRPDILKDLTGEWERYAASVGYIPSDGSSMLRKIGAERFYEWRKRPEN